MNRNAEDAKKKAEDAKKRTEEKRAARKALRDEAQKFVDEFHRKAGNNGYVSLRIRDGFIGKELSSGLLQTSRDRPRGTLVAIKDRDGGVKIGYTYLSNADEDIPIVGIAEALKVALGEKTPSKPLKNKDKGLYEFFEIRAKCYFWPEIYSHTRGTNKLSYPNYDKVHKNRNKALTFIGREDLIR